MASNAFHMQHFAFGRKKKERKESKFQRFHSVMWVLFISANVMYHIMWAPFEWITVWRCRYCCCIFLLFSLMLLLFTASCICIAMHIHTGWFVSFALLSLGVTWMNNVHQTHILLQTIQWLCILRWFYLWVKICSSRCLSALATSKIFTRVQCTQRAYE